MRLSIYPDRGLVVTVPNRVAVERALDLVSSKADWIIKKLDVFAASPVIPRLTKKDFSLHKERALEAVSGRLRRIATFYQVNHRKVFIRDQKSRWGSCSKKGNLSFNFKIVFLPPHLADYLVVHEVCHLLEFNHSDRFWQLVAQTMPEHKKHRKELKLLGRSLI